MSERALRVLLVEDDEDIRRLFSAGLMAQGLEVQTSVNGEDALALLQQAEHPSDVIVADLHMPVMDGWEFLKALHRDARLSRIPVIVLTAGDDLSREAPRPATILIKPTSIDDLVTAIRRVTHLAS